jgi:hypothetical protein
MSLQELKLQVASLLEENSLLRDFTTCKDLSKFHPSKFSQKLDDFAAKLQQGKLTISDLGSLKTEAHLQDQQTKQLRANE